MPSSAWAGWICFESEVEMEAAKGVPYRRLMLRAVQLPSEVYSSCGGEGLLCNVLYRRRSLNFQDSDRVKPLETLTSLWYYQRVPPPHFAVYCSYCCQIHSTGTTSTPAVHLLPQQCTVPI
jgi:hypothetical protein